MVGLDLTHQALATPEVVRRIAAVDTTASRFVVELLDFFGRAYHQSQGFDSPPVHDPCAVAHVIDPSIVRTRTAPVDVELTGALTTGLTVTDFRLPPAATPLSPPTSTTHASGTWWSAPWRGSAGFGCNPLGERTSAAAL